MIAPSARCRAVAGCQSRFFSAAAASGRSSRSAPSNTASNASTASAEPCLASARTAASRTLRSGSAVSRASACTESLPVIPVIASMALRRVAGSRCASAADNNPTGPATPLRASVWIATCRTLDRPSCRAATIVRSASGPPMPPRAATATSRALGLLSFASCSSAGSASAPMPWNARTAESLTDVAAGSPSFSISFRPTAICAAARPSATWPRLS